MALLGISGAVKLQGNALGDGVFFYSSVNNMKIKAFAATGVALFGRGIAV